MAGSSGIDTKEIRVFEHHLAAVEARRSQIISRALSDCADVIVSEAHKKLRRNNPLHVRTGRLFQAVTKSPVTKLGYTYIVKAGVWKAVGGSKGPGYYGRVQEFGAPGFGHFIYPRRARALRFRTHYRGGKPPIGRSVKMGPHGRPRGDLVFASRVKLPPKPWLRPAVEKSLPKIRKIMKWLGRQLTI